MKTTADIIKELRVDKDLNQKQIAEVVGTTQQHYSRYENGKHDLPLRVAIDLARYHSVSVDFIARQTDSRQSVDVLNKKFIKDRTVGEVMSDIVSLNAENRIALLEYLEYLQSKNKS